MALGKITRGIMSNCGFCFESWSFLPISQWCTESLKCDVPVSGRLWKTPSNSRASGMFSWCHLLPLQDLLCIVLACIYVEYLTPNIDPWKICQKGRQMQRVLGGSKCCWV